MGLMGLSRMVVVVFASRGLFELFVSARVIVRGQLCVLRCVVFGIVFCYDYVVFCKYFV